MKKFAFCAMVLLAGAVTFTSCSDKNDDKEEEDIAAINRTFGDADGLTLTVNGAPALGTTAKYTGSADGSTIALSSSLDLTELGAGVIPGPGVIPGSPETVIDVPADPTFSGSGESTFCTYKYNGSVSKEALTLNITDLELKDKSIAGTWKPQPYNVNEDYDSDEYGTVYSEPVYAVWESTANFDFMGTLMPMNNLLRMLLTMPLLNDMTVRIPDALTASLHEVNFGTDGYISAKYVEDFDDDEIKVTLSPANIAQYVLTGKGDMSFFINPAGVAADLEGRADAGVSALPDMNQVLAGVIAQLAPMMSEGVPMHYTTDGDNMTVYIGTELLLPLLKTNVLPLLRNEALVQMLVDLVSADEEMGAFIAPMLPAMLASAADVIEGTTRLELGINLSK